MLMFSVTSFGAVEIPESIKFEKGNFFPIVTGFNSKLLNDFTEKVLAYKDKEMLIYFNSPGGSVVALSRMARVMKSSGIKFTCVANYAASAGFMLFQHCDKRLLLSDGILMSHNWAGGFRDEGPRILTLYNAIQSLVDRLEKVVIEKMNVNAEEYAALINNNLWMPDSLAIKYAAIDGIVDKVTCSDGLLKKRIFLGSDFGASYFTSGCPLINKIYRKVGRDEYVHASEMPSLFKLAQKTYVEEQANMIYLGNVPFE